MKNKDNQNHAPDPAACEDELMREATSAGASEAPLTPEEDERYRALLSMAYPQTPRSIKDGVLSQIRADKAQKRTERRRSFVKYGSIAACFIVITAAITTIAPILNGGTGDKRAADTSVWTDSDEEETVSDTSNASNEIGAANLFGAAVENSLPAYAATEQASRTDMTGNDAPDKTDGTIAGDTTVNPTTDEAEAAIVDTPPTPEPDAAPLHEDADEIGEALDGVDEIAPSEAPADTNDTADLSDVNSSNMDSSYLNNSSDDSGMNHSDMNRLSDDSSMETGIDSADSLNLQPCTKHSDAYHTLTDALRNYVGEKAFADWLTSGDAVADCGLPSVASFVRYFSIDRALFISLTDGDKVPYDLDELYSGAE